MGADGLLAGTVKKTAKHSLIYGLGTSVSALSGLILVPLYTRFLDPSAYGVYSLVSIVFGLLFFLYDFGMVNALFRWYHQYGEHEAEKREGVVHTAFVFNSSLAFFMTLIFFIGAPVISRLIFSSAEQTGLIRVMLIGVFLQSLTIIPLSFLRIKERVGMFTTLAVSSIVFLAAVNYFLLSLGRGVRGIYEGYIITYFCMVVVLFVFMRSVQGARFSLPDLKGMLKFGLPYIPVLFFSWVIDYSDRYILGQLVTLDQVGLYSVGYKIGQMLYVAEKTFLIAWMPLMMPLAQQFDARAREVIGRMLTYFSLATLFLFLVIAVLSPEIIAVFAAPAYAGAAMVIPWVGLAYVLYGVYIFMLSGLIVAKDVYAQPLILLAAACANIWLNILLIPRFGILGSAYATVLSYCAAAVATWYCAQRLYPIVIEWGRLARIAAAVVCVYAFSLPIHCSSVLVSCVCKGMVLVLFFALLYMSGFLRPEETKWLKTVLLRKSLNTPA